LCVHRDATLVEACRLMRAWGTAELLVVADTGECTEPLGKLSARDIALRVVALGLDPSVLTAGDVLLVDET
jgi:hypothetical protein